jgi:L-cystine uptake protein TcyP (sodium:dicarboxylate symporter family)
MEFNLPVTVVTLLVIVAIGTAGLIGMGAMATSTVLMMVAPSMLVFGLIALFIGVKHGEYRATR